MSQNDTITRIDGIRVGHHTDREGGTGCTVVLLPAGARGGVVLRGRAHGTRELTPLDPGSFVNEVHAIVLSGGSAFGLSAADGVMQWLEEQGIGFETGVARVPIVPAAVLYDLHVGMSMARPGRNEGYQAAAGATSDPVVLGNAGAGTGATVGKILGVARAMKGGTGSASRVIAGGITVAALAVCNALGDVVDPASGNIVAGARSDNGILFADTAKVLQHLSASPFTGGNTTLAVVATDASLDRSALSQVADMAHDGLARAIRPVHTMMDGDAVFAVSAGDRPGDINAIGSAAADVIAEAVLRGILSAESLHGVPAAKDLPVIGATP